VAEWEGPWHYDMTELGYNYRLSDIQSGLGLSQLGKLENFIDRRRALAREYAELLASIPEIRPPTEGDQVRHAYHLYIVRIDFEGLGLSRRDFFAYCQDRGVKPQVHYRPVPLNSYYAGRPINADVRGRIPVAMRYYSQALSLPLYPRLTESEVERVVETLKEGLHGVH
jgi:perosamine synthetase